MTVPDDLSIEYGAAGKGGRVLVTVAVVISIVTATSEAPPRYRAPGTQRMVERLEAIAQSSNPETNTRLNAQRVKYFRSRLDRPLDPYNRLMLRALVAQELLYAGKTQEAIEEFLYVQREVNQKPLVSNPRLTHYRPHGSKNNGQCARHDARDCEDPLENPFPHIQSSRRATLTSV